MDLNELVNNYEEDLRAALNEKDAARRTLLIRSILNDLEKEFTKFISDNTGGSTRMTVNEYKDKFIELFRQLQKEHGKPESVYISTDDICDDTGYVIESTPKCSIDF